MTELRTLRWGDEPGLSSWAQYKHKCPYNSKAGESGHRKEGWWGERRRWKQKPKKEIEDAVFLALKMEEGAISQELSAGALEAGRGKNSNSTPEPPEGTQPCKHLDSNSVRTILSLCPWKYYYYYIITLYYLRCWVHSNSGCSSNKKTRYWV